MELKDLPNIGKNLAEKLEVCGVKDSEQLIELGTERVFVKLKTVFPDSCINTLYAIEGAVQNIRWHNLDKERKFELNEFFRGL